MAAEVEEAAEEVVVAAVDADAMAVQVARVVQASST